jgi:ribosomal protein S9
LVSRFNNAIVYAELPKADGLVTVQVAVKLAVAKTLLPVTGAVKATLATSGAMVNESPETRIEAY